MKPPAAAAVFPREVRRRTEADPRVAEARARLRGAAPEERPRLREAPAALRADALVEHRAAVAREFDAVHTVERACAVGSLDEVIPRAELRARLVAHLRAARG